MSNQIEDLIANIQQKFDDEFRAEPQNQSASKNENQLKNKQPNQNPESFQASPTSGSEIKNESQLNHQIVIQQDHENDSNSQVEHENINQKRKLDYGESQDNKEDEGDEQNENKYKDLSTKLETALKKISSSKKQFTSYHSAVPSSDYLNRFEDYQKKKEKDLEAKRRVQEQKKYHGLKSKPDINKKSQQIAVQTSYKPIYERFDQIVQQKKKKLQSNVENKKVLEEEEYERFVQEYKKHAKVEASSCRDISTYFNDMMSWKAKLEKEREQKLRQKQIKQKEGYTFKPEINKKSERMLKNQKRVPIQEREIERPKTQQSEFTFQPKINKRRVP